VLSLAARMARHRIGALVAVAGAVLGGVALLTGTGVLAESGLRSHLPAGRLAGADVLVTAEQTVRPAGDLPVALPERRPVPAGLVGRLSRLPGVTAAVGDLSFPAALVDPDGRVVPAPDPRVTGHGWSSAALLAGVRPDGAAPAGDAEVALDGGSAAAAGVGPGGRVDVVAAGRPGSYRVSAVLAGAPAGIYFNDRTAVRLAGRDRGPRTGTVDLVALRGAGVADAVRTELRGSGLTVATGGDRGDAAEPGGAAARSTLVLLAGSLAGTILLVVGFVVAGALAVALGGQRRELALLRATGATPKQLRRLAAAQVTVVAGLVLLPGVAAGYGLAYQFRGLLARLGVIPAELPLALSPLPAVAAALLMVAGVQLSARAAAWRLSRMPATAAVAESRTEPRRPPRARTGAGLLLLAAAGTLSVGPLLTRTDYGAAATSLAGIVAAIGLALAGPAAVAALSRPAVRRLPATTSAPTWLAVTNVRGHALRTGRPGD
jgi:putative ABC transport system permease protein